MCIAYFGLNKRLNGLSVKESSIVNKALDDVAVT
jgi:hypothetical protein